MSLFFGGCTTIESISVNQIPVKSQRKSIVRAEESSPIIFLIPFGSSFVDEARHKLIAQCEGGAIEGVLTKFETHNYFLGLILTQNVLMQGYCSKPHSKKS